MRIEIADSGANGGSVRFRSLATSATVRPPLRLFPVLLVLAFCTLGGAPVPSELEAALRSFRSDPPAGWSFTQTTVAEGRSTVERCDAARPEFNRWTLVRKDGQPPDTHEARVYAEGRSRRSRTGTAPKLADQLNLASLETIADSAERATYRCRLRPGEASDRTSPHLRATLVLHKASGTIESVELGSVASFSPTLGVRITEMNTRMTYSLPAGDTPSLPQSVVTRVRGRAFWFKSLDAEMSVTYSDYVNTWKK